MSEEFQGKYGTPRRTPRSAASTSPLSLRDTAVAARNEEHRLLVLERQLEQQMEAVRHEKKDIEGLLRFLERKGWGEPPI